MNEDARPWAAIVLTAIAAFLVLIDAGALAFAQSVFATAGFFGTGSLVGFLSIWEGLMALVLFALAAALFRRPEEHGGLGVGIAVVSLLSLFGGGGLLAGTVLGVIGGILAYVFVDEEEPTEPLFPPIAPADSSRSGGSPDVPFGPGP